MAVIFIFTILLILAGEFVYLNMKAEDEELRQKCKTEYQSETEGTEPWKQSVMRIFLGVAIYKDS